MKVECCDADKQVLEVDFTISLSSEDVCDRLAASVLASGSIDALQAEE